MARGQAGASTSEAESPNGARAERCSDSTGWSRGTSCTSLDRPAALRLNPARRRGLLRERAKQVRQAIAKELVLDEQAALKLSFTMTSKDAWYLGRARAWTCSRCSTLSKAARPSSSS